MEDPVTAPDGETYERASLERGDGATALLARSAAGARYSQL